MVADFTFDLLIVRNFRKNSVVNWNIGIIVYVVDHVINGIRKI